MKGPISASLLVFLGLSCGGDSGQVNTPELPPQKEVATITPNPATAGMAWLRAHVLLDSMHGQFTLEVLCQVFMRY